MATVKATMNIRFREATDEELKKDVLIFMRYPPDDHVKSETFDYYILEQQHRIEDIEGVRFEWRGIEIADESKTE